MKQFLGALVLGLAVVGSAHARPAGRVYPNVIRDAFIRGCTTEASHRACSCAIDEIARRHSFDELLAIMKRSEARHEKFPVALLPAALACLDVDEDTAF